MLNAELLAMEKKYKASVEEWVAAIRSEEDLTSGPPTLSQLEAWRQAHCREEDARRRAKNAKMVYEAAVRDRLFRFCEQSFASGPSTGCQAARW